MQGPRTDPVAVEGAPKFDEPPSVLQKLQKWGDYEAYGGAVAPTKFLPMKTPLGHEILEDWNLDQPPRYPLSIAILRQHQELHGKRIGMIIDLSNHDSLYSADLEETGIQYERVPLVAKIFPAQRAINQVVEKAERFWGERPDLYIGIHCAYGFNRTGFVLCSYLVQVCNYTVQEALDSFAAARPPGIRHEQFVEELHKRYSSWRMEHPVTLDSSFSDLRGFAAMGSRQRVDSLQSDFLGVAEHLHDHHPSLGGRLSGVSGVSGSNPGSSILESQDEVVLGSSPPLDPSHRPPVKGRLPTAGPSDRSLQSVNNESLDLDERDIYQQFARRQDLPGEAVVNGHHRRPPLKHILPVIGSAHSGSPASSSLNSPTSRQQSPFAAESNPCGLPQFPGGGLGKEDLQNGAASPLRSQPADIPAEPGGPPLHPRPPLSAPISARICRDNSSAKWTPSSGQARSNLSFTGSQEDVHKKDGKERAQSRPCSIM